MKIDYKLQTENEDIKYYNQKVAKLDTTYKLRISLPYWIDSSYVFSLFPLSPKKGDDIVMMIDNPYITGEGLEKVHHFKINYHIHTTSKCKDDDKFDEIIGLHICETKAEIKALEIIRKFMVNLKVNLELDEEPYYRMGIRLAKNHENLDRLSN